MTDYSEQASTSTLQSPGEQEPDPIDVEAAEIDARSPEAPEQIKERDQA